jgi:hypothetical protein
MWDTIKAAIQSNATTVRFIAIIPDVTIGVSPPVPPNVCSRSWSGALPEAAVIAAFQASWCSRRSACGWA